MHIAINIIHFNTIVYFIISCLLIIVLIQFILILKYRKLFKKLSLAFFKNEKLRFTKLVERIIFSRELYTSRASDEAVELIFNFIKDISDEARVFIHVTKEKEIAESILSEGFKYSDSLSKSSEEVTANIIDLKYKLQIYKNYGKYVIIICVPRKISQENIKKEVKMDKDIFVEYGISEYNLSTDLSYKLPSKYIRAYIDTEKMKIVENELFKNDYETNSEKSVS